MSFAATREMARKDRLYPSVILYGGSPDERREAVLELARILLCTEVPGERPCGTCRHCRRVAWPEAGAERFHPDFHVLERDLRTSTSVATTKNFLTKTSSSPFEGRGQIFVVAEADSLSPGAADALLKILEEPPDRSPRHFFLLAPSRLDLLPTLRSRSLSIFLGESDALDEDVVTELAEPLARALDGYIQTGAPVLLLVAAKILAGVPGNDDVRAKTPWALAAASILRYVQVREVPVSTRRALLALAADLQDGWQLRLRAIPADRILEGLVARHLTGL